jgi:hypothetical protein
LSTNCVRCVVNARTRPDLLCDACGRAQDTTARSMEAIRHVLERIRDDEAVGYFLGVGTESFRLLIIAAAHLWDVPIDEVERLFTPRNPVDPRVALQKQLDQARGG